VRATWYAAVIFALALLAPTRLAAQGEEADVLAVIQQLFQAMHARDTVALRAVFDPAADLVTTGRDRQGMWTVQRAPIDDFITSVGRATIDLDERIHDVEVRIDDHLASVWARYDFYADGQFRHCGVDAFHLARGTGGWRIVALADTRRTDGCDAQPGER
jgi:hypothetical protein